MTERIQLMPETVVVAGDECFQVSAQQDYADAAHFLAVIQPLFDRAARHNDVTFGAIVVDTAPGTVMVDGEPQEDAGAVLWRATATAA
jgi:hypothetical protein